jgi:HPt (histidine-containing phosphotransfer) domain-containing protein
MAVSCVLERGGDSAPTESPSGAFEVTELLRRCMGDHDLAATLVERFTGRLAATIQEIERALAADDRSRAGSIVHNLKGEAGNMGATHLHRDAAALEDCLRAGHQAEAEFHFGRLKSTAEHCWKARAGALEQLHHSD